MNAIQKSDVIFTLKSIEFLMRKLVINPSEVLAMRDSIRASLAELQSGIKIIEGAKND